VNWTIHVPRGVPFGIVFRRLHFSLGNRPPVSRFFLIHLTILLNLSFPLPYGSKLASRGPRRRSTSPPFFNYGLSFLSFFSLILSLPDFSIVTGCVFFFAPHSFLTFPSLCSPCDFKSYPGVAFSLFSPLFFSTDPKQTPLSWELWPLVHSCGFLAFTPAFPTLTIRFCPVSLISILHLTASNFFLLFP